MMACLAVEVDLKRMEVIFLNYIFSFSSELKCFGSSYYNVGNDDTVHTKTL